MSLRRVSIVVAALGLLLPVTGCSEVQSALPSTPETVAEEPLVASTDADVSGELGSEIPADIPVWPEAKVISAEEIEGGSWLVVLETSEPYEDVVLGMGVGFERAGWEVAEGGEEETLTMLDVSGSGYQGVVTVYSANAGTSIEYLLMPAEDGAGA